MNTTYYRFFDTVLSFQTNSKTAGSKFRRIYERFEAPHKLPADIACSIIKSTNSYHITAKSKHYCTEYTLEGKLHADVYLSLFSPVLYEVKDYLLIHAGSLLSGDKNGVIISAPCGFGKTTLTLELIKHGFRFMSDELAPINRSTGMVHPYPRGIGILKGKNKRVLTPVKNADTPSKPAYVFFLTLREEDRGRHDTRYLELALARENREINKQIKELPGVKETTAVNNRLFPVLRLKIPKGTYITPEIQKICTENNVPIIYAVKGKTYPPDFYAAPCVTQISAKEGVFRLSQNILNAHNSALIEDVFSGSHSRMIFELAQMAGGAKFFTLTTGKLRDMVNLIKGICRG